MTNVSSLRRGAVGRLAKIADALQILYSTPEASLGNKSDPLDEAIYIVLSFQTGLARFSSTWSELRAAYPTWDAVEHAAPNDIAHVIRGGGLHRQKSRTIRHLLASVRQVAGKLSLDLLRKMNDEEAERLLIRLPGLSWKAARCVLLYSLGRDVLPIDSNAFRILKRTGVLPLGAVYRRRTLHDAIQAAVPPNQRRALHVNLVVHGQQICLPRDPQCVRCALIGDCPKAGIPIRGSRRIIAHSGTAQKDTRLTIAHK